MINILESTPKETVKILDQYIIGQNDAKKSVAIALRNRWRRMQLDDEWRQEITPKNILMIGPTGVGKTEIARRLATLSGAPFIKVEATKFTEVGYVGRDVETIIRDLVEAAVVIIRNQAMEKVYAKAKARAIEYVLDILVGEKKDGDKVNPARAKFLKKINKGQLDDKEIDIQVASSIIGIEIQTPPGMEEMRSQLQDVLTNLHSEKKQMRCLSVRDAIEMITEEESFKLVNLDQVKNQAVDLVEERGIVFIDEIDKITSSGSNSSDVSRDGVQRDLLPLIEGTSVTTRYGQVKTDFILFIASGAFHLSKPSDLIPELQGRLPIRVELKALSAEDFAQILTEPKGALVKQYQQLLSTEDLSIKFTPKAIKRLAQLAWEVNENTENIGARRLYTLMEKLLADISYDIDVYTKKYKNKEFSISATYVDSQLASFAAKDNLARYIL